MSDYLRVDAAEESWDVDSSSSSQSASPGRSARALIPSPESDSMEDSPPRQQSLHNLGLPGSPGGSSILANAVAEKFKFRGNAASMYLHNDCDSLSCSPPEEQNMKGNQVMDIHTARVETPEAKLEDERRDKETRISTSEAKLEDERRDKETRISMLEARMSTLEAELEDERRDKATRISTSEAELEDERRDKETRISTLKAKLKHARQPLAPISGQKAQVNGKMKPGLQTRRGQQWQENAIV